MLVYHASATRLEANHAMQIRGEVKCSQSSSVTACQLMFYGRSYQYAYKKDVIGGTDTLAQVGSVLGSGH